MLNMEKNTIGTKLPRKLEQKMQIVGDYIRLHIAGFRANKKPLKISGFIIVGSNSLQSVAFFHFPTQKCLNTLLSTS